EHRRPRRLRERFGADGPRGRTGARAAAVGSAPRHFAPAGRPLALGRDGRLRPARSERAAGAEGAGRARRRRIRAGEDRRRRRVRRGADPRVRARRSPGRLIRRRLGPHPRRERLHRRRRPYGRSSIGQGWTDVQGESAPRARGVTLEVHPLTPERWPDFVDLFERRGPRGGWQNAPAYGCWCMYWRDRTVEHGEPKKRALEKIVCAGRETGLLAYTDGKAVGWISVAPREEYSALLRSPQYRPHEDEGGVWSIVCFTVDKDARGRGVNEALLEAGVEHAFARGASAVEAYPHLEKRGDYMGHVELFRAHGFQPVRETSKRIVVRRELIDRRGGRRGSAGAARRRSP